MNARAALALAAMSTSCSSYFTPAATPRRDAGPEAGADVATVVHGCTEARFVDRSDPSADRAVAFGGALGMNFSPPCITIAAGQTVRFDGNLASHPLTPGVVGVAGSGAGSAISLTTSGDTVSVTFPAAGSFPFHCGVHGPMGMVGVVRVR